MFDVNYYDFEIKNLIILQNILFLETRYSMVSIKNYSVKFDQVVDDSLQQTILEGNDNEQPIIDIYVAGQDCATSSIKEIGVTLVKRDFPKVAASLGLNDKDIGVISIPDTFIPKKARIVKPEIAEEVLQYYPDDNKLRVSKELIN